jgi:hypothetical protein
LIWTLPFAWQLVSVLTTPALSMATNTSMLWPSWLSPAPANLFRVLAMLWDHRLTPPLPAFQLPLDSLPNDVGNPLALRQSGLYAGSGPLWESSGDLFEIYLRSAHFVDITY